ncbi:MAG: FAD:protein FMN transferase [Gemmatimonadales bacterium]|nr:FAD:protein FMN transferase [Gemmatimonadales bacterium]NIN10197.1 FAD:protein FMN transferase [Gemmatimonadales bacterium]NIN48953.1 FAD:protein FMN transferase [Gemmatimonadales bacterium]NIP06417.1 FAD:protein FMN transferase [Gemmatimonadales bacterium]NIQ98769.1 FAD:protein FMN transferase [Gemmatimonadales bacterium]
MQETARIAKKLAALEALGLERVDVSPTTSEAVRVDRKTHKVTSSRPAMGTLVSISALARSQERLEEAIGRGFEEMDRLIGVFSRFDGSSAVTHLNDTGRLDDAPPEFSRVVAHSLDYHGLSRGAFDITVEPVVDLFRVSLEGEVPKQPTESEILEALQLVGSRHIALSERGVSFAQSGMGITLDGIAKGYIVDAIARVLVDHKVKSYLINAGGDIRAAGGKEQGRPWTVAVQDPSRGARFPDTIHLTDGAVATSGSYEIYFDRDKLFHHIVNSKTGRSPHLSTSVSVIAPSTMAADALATGVFVMDPGEGIALIDALPSCECLIIDRDGLQLKSRGWNSAAPTRGE